MKEYAYDISVICPCYNGAATLRRALDSVLRQHGVSVELIVVDDCSTDNSAEIINDFSRHIGARDSNIRNLVILHHEINRGAAAAYLTGVNNASGKYLTKLDADDEFCDNALSLMFKAGMQNNADIVCGEMIERYTNGKDVVRCCDTPYELNNLTVDTANFSLHSRLISRELIVSNHLFPTPGIDCWEDLSVVSRCLSFEPKCIVINKPVYIYYQYPATSLSHSKSERLLSDHLKIAVELTEYFSSRGLSEKFSPFLNYMQFCAKVKMLRSWPKDVKKWKETFPASNRHILRYKRIPLHLRLLFKCVAFLPSSFSQSIFNMIYKL